MSKRGFWIIALLALVSMALKCGNKCFDVDQNGNPVEVPCPSPLPSISPSEPPTAPPTLPPTEPPTAPPTLPPTAPPTAPPTPTPPPVSCDDFKPTTTGWGILGCTLSNKVVCTQGACNKPPFMTGGPGMQLYHFKAGTVCDADSTPRYLGDVPCWKSGVVERCEYPPKPSPGWDCGATTMWSWAGPVKVFPEDDGYGAKMKFDSTGSGSIVAARKGIPGLSTKKGYVVN